MLILFKRCQHQLQSIDMYQQNNSPPRNYGGNISLNGPSGQFSSQGPQLSLNAQTPEVGLGQHHHSSSFNSSLQGQGPSVNVSGPGQYSPPQHQFSSSNQFSGQGPQINANLGGGQFSSHDNYSGRGQGPEVNVNFNGPQGQYGMNGPEGNFNVGMNQQDNYDSGMMPTTSEGIRQFITKRPYTQTLDFEDITYSIIPKKQQTFVMTHDRFLLLKGVEILGYARQFPANQPLPFNSLAEVPAPKTVVPLSGIAKVDVQEEKLIVTHLDEKKTVWEFVCPTKRCAIEWHQKILEAMDLLRQFNNSGFQTTAEFYRFKKGGLGSGNHFQSSPPPIESPPREFPRLDPTPPQNNFQFKVNHDDEVSRSVYDNSGPKASPNKFGNFSSDVNVNNQYSSPVKNQYEVNYQVNQHSPQQGSLNVNANYQGSQGSTIGGSGRSYTVSSSSSLGRYPMGMPMGGQQPMMHRGNSHGQPSNSGFNGSLNMNANTGLNTNFNTNANTNFNSNINNQYNRNY